MGLRPLSAVPISGDLALSGHKEVQQCLEVLHQPTLYDVRGKLEQFREEIEVSIGRQWGGRQLGGASRQPLVRGKDRMPAKVQEQGHYELFNTSHQHHILVLNDKQWFAWVQGQQGEILVHSDADHQKQHTLQTGQFYLVDFEDDPTYKDMPHLFL
jgi:hypothetical protein